MAHAPKPSVADAASLFGGVADSDDGSGGLDLFGAPQSQIEEVSTSDAPPSEVSATAHATEQEAQVQAQAPPTLAQDHAEEPTAASGLFGGEQSFDLGASLDTSTQPGEGGAPQVEPSATTHLPAESPTALFGGAAVQDDWLNPSPTTAAPAADVSTAAATWPQQEQGGEDQQQVGEYTNGYAQDHSQQQGGYEGYDAQASGYGEQQQYSAEGVYNSNAYYGEQSYTAEGQGGAYDPSADINGQYNQDGQAYDPNAQYDLNAQYSYDPNAQYSYDPNAQYDASGQYDPNAAQQYDPNAAQYDPNTQYDPSAQYDVSGQQQAYDPNAYDPNAYGSYEYGAAGQQAEQSQSQAGVYDPYAPVPAGQYDQPSTEQYDQAAGQYGYSQPQDYASQQYGAYDAAPSQAAAAQTSLLPTQPAAYVPPQSNAYSYDAPPPPPVKYKPYTPKPADPYSAPAPTGSPYASAAAAGPPKGPPKGPPRGPPRSSSAQRGATPTVPPPPQTQQYVQEAANAPWEAAPATQAQYDDTPWEQPAAEQQQAPWEQAPAQSAAPAPWEQEQITAPAPWDSAPAQDEPQAAEQQSASWDEPQMSSTSGEGWVAGLEDAADEQTALEASGAGARSASEHDAPSEEELAMESERAVQDGSEIAQASESTELSAPTDVEVAPSSAPSEPEQVSEADLPSQSSPSEMVQQLEEMHLDGPAPSGDETPMPLTSTSVSLGEEQHEAVLEDDQGTPTPAPAITLTGDADASQEQVDLPDVNVTPMENALALGTDEVLENEGHGYGYSQDDVQTTGATAEATSDPYAAATTDPYAASGYAPQTSYDPYPPSDAQVQSYETDTRGGAGGWTASEASESGSTYDPYGSYAPTSVSGVEETEQYDPTSSALQNPYGPPPVSNGINASYDAYGPPAGYGDSLGDVTQQPQNEQFGLYGQQANSSAYAPSTSSSESIYDPYGPSPSATASNYDPYTTDDPEGDQAQLTKTFDPQGPPPPPRASSYSPYGPPPSQPTSTYDPYGEEEAPQQPHQAPYDPYAATQSQASSYDPYGAPPQSLGHQSRQASEAVSEDMHTPIASDPYGSTWNPRPQEKSAYDSSVSGLGRSDTVTQRSYGAAGGEAAPYPTTPVREGISEEREVPLSPYGPSSLYAPGDPGTASPYGPAPPSAARSEFSSHSRGGSYAPSARGGTHPDTPDPVLERRSASIPLACFSVDGRLVTFFPNSRGGPDDDVADGGPSYAALGAGNSSSPTRLRVRKLKTLVSPSAYASTFDPLSFPAPLFEGAVTAQSALARAAGASTGPSAAKKKEKVAIVAKLREAAEETKRGAGYLRVRPGEGDGDGARQEEAKKDALRQDDKALLIEVLAALLEADGDAGSPAFDAAVRAALVGDTATEVSSFAGSNVSSASSPNPLHTYSVQSSFLDRIQALVQRGEKVPAVHLAVEQRMWGHALTIASSVDKDLWRWAVDEFAKFEMESFGGQKDRLSLRVAYSYFAGQTPTHIYNLVRPTEGSPPNTGLPAPSGIPTHALLKNSTPSSATSVPRRPDWQPSVASILANRSGGTEAAALTAIGDGLLAGGWYEAAHLCYILSPSTAAFGGVDTPSVRMTLLGSPSPRASSAFERDLDAVVLSECFEFALSLAPVPKGAEPFNGIPHLQAFRLAHAYQLAELGETTKAQKYCDAIAATLKSGKPSPYFHRTLVDQLKVFSERLTGGSSGGEGSTGWIAGKMKRPTLDSMWGALEGRFTKFIAGEEDGPGDRKETRKLTKDTSNSNVIGPFSHYSAITPDATSGGVSRVQSYANFDDGQGRSVGDSSPGSRAGSSMGFHIPQRISSPAIRASSAMGVRQPLRDPYSEWPQGEQSGPPSLSFSAFGDRSDVPSSEQSSEHGYDGPYRSSGPTNNAPWYGEAAQNDEAAPGQAPYYGYQPHGAGGAQFASNLSPTDPTSGAGNFVSPMDSLYVGPQQPYSTPSNSGQREETEVLDEEDDLGLGNSSSRRKSNTTVNGREGKEDAAAKAFREAQEREERERNASKKPELKSAASGSWLGRLWSGRRDSSGDESGPGGAATAAAKAKKAHLGEETAFYYDENLKRWVNKKADASSSGASTPAPPPPRAQTASPSMHSGRGVGGPPPGRRGSFDPASGSPSPHSISEDAEYTPSSTFSPPRGMPRARSNLGDPSLPPAVQPPMRAASGGPGGPSSAPPSNVGTPPPPGGGLPPPRSGGAKKKPIKNRYVVVD